MLQSLTSGISGLRVHQQRMDVTANDVANVNTVGYKQSEVTFKESLVNTIRRPAPGTPGLQVGMGTALSGITKDFTYGMLENTGVASHLALQGEGFFGLEYTDGVYYYTRAGDFVLDVVDDDSVYLINSDSMPLVGTDGDPINLAGYVSFSVAMDGTVVGITEDGEPEEAGQIWIAVFENNNGLESIGSSMFRYTEAAGDEPTPTDGNPANAGLIQQGYLERSNTELAKEFIDMIVTQRGFQANSRTISTSDEILQELLMLKR